MKEWWKRSSPAQRGARQQKLDVSPVGNQWCSGGRNRKHRDQAERGSLSPLSARRVLLALIAGLPD